MAAPVALIGLGNMGLAVAERLLDADHRVLVYNRTAGRDDELLARGAARLDAPAAALQVADVCLLTLADDSAVEHVAASVFSGARGGTTLVEMSTISVAASARVADAAAACRVDYVRAPFSGNPTAVRSGKAVILASGERATVERVTPLLRAIAPTVHDVGDGERARALKLVLQIIIGGTAELLAEAIVLGEAAGLERRQLLEIVGASVVGSTFVTYKTEPLLRDDYSATFTTTMMRKDVDLVLDLARENEVELPLTGELRGVLDAACEHGYRDDDFISVVKELKERSGARTPTRDG